MTKPAEPGRWLGLTLGAFFLLTAALGFASKGVYQDDDLTHFLFARWAGWFPSYLLHVWGRPGLTVPLAAVSWLPDVDTAWHGARLLSAIATAGSALIAARLTMRMGVARAWLVVVLCYAQPLASVLATTTLTENFAGLYLVAAVALLQAKRLISGSVMFSLLLVTRHEAVALVPVWMVGVWMAGGGRARLIAAAFAMASAPIVHNVLFFVTFGTWPFSIFSQATGSTEYLPAGPLGYVPDALYAMTPFVLALAIIGGAALWRRGEWLTPALVGTFLLTHILIRWFGVFASGGYGRFMVTVAPLAAILATAGLEELRAFSGSGRRSNGPWVIIAAVWLIGLVAIEQQRTSGRFVMDDRLVWSLRVCVVAIVVLSLWLGRAGRSAWARRAGLGVLGLTVLAQWIVIVTPLHERGAQRFTRDIVAWLENQGYSEGPFFATNPWFSLHLDLIENPRAHKGPTLLASMPVGTVVLWDSEYSGSDYHRVDLERLRDAAHYEPLGEFQSRWQTPLKVWAFRKTRSTPLPESPDECYPPNPAAEKDPVLGVYYVRP